MRRAAEAHDPTLTRRGVGPAGTLLVLLAIWVGFIPFVGPYFNYKMGTTNTWHMTADHFWLSVLPAVAILVGGWMIGRARRTPTAMLGGLLAFAGSFWLVIGPHFAALWKHGTVGGGPAFGGTGPQVAEWLGFYYAAGALGILLSAYAMGYFAAIPVLTRRLRDERVARGGYDERERVVGRDRTLPDGQMVERERISDGGRSVGPAEPVQRDEPVVRRG